MMDFFTRRNLQITVAVLSLVPLIAGMLGMVYGVKMTGEGIYSAAIDSHVRYLSGILFAIGIGFLASVPQIERHGPLCRLLAAIVFIGGLSRLAGVITMAWPGIGMSFGLVMELLVTPLLCLWQWRVARDQAPAAPDAAFPE